MRKGWSLSAVSLLACPSIAAPVVTAVPEGWTVVAETSGDLTGDGRADRAIIIQQQDPTKRLAHEGLGSSEIDTNPRHLIVMQGTAQGYRQIAIGKSLIPSKGDPESPCLADPIEDGGIGIKRGKLTVTLHYWLSCGSYGVSNRSLIYRLEQGRFRLIGFEGMSFMRSSGEGEKISANYLTGRVSYTTGLTVIGDEPVARPRTRWKRFAASRRFLDDPRPPDCLEAEAAFELCGTQD